MDERSKTLLKGLLVVLTLALSNQRLLDVKETNEILLTGAMTVLTLIFSRDQFVDTIKVTTGVKHNINGSLVADPTFAEKTLTSIKSTLSQLTPTETDVLRLMARGTQNQEIAKKLGVSESTVRNYLNSMLRKLNTSLTSNVVAKAVRSSFVNVMNTLNFHHYHKGSTCFYKPILCQEGWCSECNIYRESAIESSTWLSSN